MPGSAVLASRVPSISRKNSAISSRKTVKDVAVQKAPSNAPETIGDVVPQNIRLYSLPPVAAKKVAQVKSHLFFVKEGKQAIVLVSPDDRRVADVIH